MLPDDVWRQPERPLVLSPGDVHVWRVALDQPGKQRDSLRDVLSNDEHARAERFLIERVQKRFIVSRGVLRQVLGEYLSCDPASLRFIYGANGKPALEGAPLHFNLSHSDDLMLLAVSARYDVGIDVEHIHPIANMDGIAARFFSTPEEAQFCALPDAEKVSAFFNIWTRKEAFVKARGESFGHMLARFQVSHDADSRLLAVDDEPNAPSRWSLQALYPAPGYAAALAVEGCDYALRCWT